MNLGQLSSNSIKQWQAKEVFFFFIVKTLTKRPSITTNEKARELWYNAASVAFFAD